MNSKRKMSVLAHSAYVLLGWDYTIGLSVSFCVTLQVDMMATGFSKDCSLKTVTQTFMITMRTGRESSIA